MKNFYTCLYLTALLLISDAAYGTEPVRPRRRCMQRRKDGRLGETDKWVLAKSDSRMTAATIIKFSRCPPGPQRETLPTS